MEESTRAAAVSFDAIAADYEAHRPTYPDALVDLAAERAGLAAGSHVLEVGCGTGQLTASLLARGWRVTAVEPGPQLAAMARQRLDDGSGALNVQPARLEDARLAPRSFAAVLSAAAFHWVDPDVGWGRVAQLLAPGGSLALIQHIGVDDPVLGPDQGLVLDTLRRCAPAAADAWPPLRSRAALCAGLDARRGNVSELWGWIAGRPDLARAAAGPLFADVAVALEPVVFEQTAAQLGALLRTLSFHARLDPEQVTAIDASLLAHEQRLGRPLRSAGLVVLATARVVG